LNESSKEQQAERNKKLNELFARRLEFLNKMKEDGKLK
jgi:hypothetical protein